jgi:hypothetical protein
MIQPIRRGEGRRGSGARLAPYYPGFAWIFPHRKSAGAMAFISGMPRFVASSLHCEPDGWAMVSKPLPGTWPDVCGRLRQMHLNHSVPFHLSNFNRLSKGQPDSGSNLDSNRHIFRKLRANAAIVVATEDVVPAVMNFAIRWLILVAPGPHGRAARATGLRPRPSPLPAAIGRWVCSSRVSSGICKPRQWKAS